MTKNIITELDRTTKSDTTKDEETGHTTNVKTTDLKTEVETKPYSAEVESRENATKVKTGDDVTDVEGLVPTRLKSSTISSAKLVNAH